MQQKHVEALRSIIIKQKTLNAQAQRRIWGSDSWLVGFRQFPASPTPGLDAYVSTYVPPYSSISVPSVCVPYTRCLADALRRELILIHLTETTSITP